MRTGDLSKLEFQRLSTNITWELLLLILERYRPRKQLFLRSGHLYFYTIQSLTTVYFSVLSNNLSNWRYKQLFFAPTFYKKNSIFCRLKSRLVTSSLTCLWAFSRASVLIHQSTCGKSNQFTNLPTHSGLEGILSNYMYLSVQEEGFPVWTSLLLFTVCQPPSVNFNVPNLSPTITHIRIGPIVRRVPPIKNDHVYPCDSAGYQNELLCTNSQYTNKWSRWCVGQLQCRLIDCRNLIFFTEMISWALWFSQVQS